MNGVDDELVIAADARASIDALRQQKIRAQRGIELHQPAMLEHPTSDGLDHSGKLHASVFFLGLFAEA